MSGWWSRSPATPPSTARTRHGSTNWRSTAADRWGPGARAGAGGSQHPLALAEGDHPGVGDGVELAVALGVDADGGARRHVDVLVQHRAAHDGAAPDPYVVVQHRALHDRAGVHDHAG